MKGQALRPDLFFKDIPTMQKAKTGEEPTEEEKQLHAMSTTNGWARLSEFKDELVKDLDRVNKQAIANGATFEQIGQNTLIINMATDVIERLFNKVSDAVEAVENNGRK